MNKLGSISFTDAQDGRLPEVQWFSTYNL
jgi:hypothetical protein